jgi:hypothetical protein
MVGQYTGCCSPGPFTLTLTPPPPAFLGCRQSSPIPRGGIREGSKLNNEWRHHLKFLLAARLEQRALGVFPHISRLSPQHVREWCTSLDRDDRPLREAAKRFKRRPVGEFGQCAGHRLTRARLVERALQVWIWQRRIASCKSKSPCAQAMTPALTKCSGEMRRFGRLRVRSGTWAVRVGWLGLHRWDRGARLDWRNCRDRLHRLIDRHRHGSSNRRSPLRLRCPGNYIAARWRWNMRRWPRCEPGCRSSADACASSSVVSPSRSARSSFCSRRAARSRRSLRVPLCLPPARQ